MPKPTRSSKPEQSEQIAHLSIAFLGKKGEPPPTEFCIFKPGPNESAQGVFKLTQDSAKRVMSAASKYGNDLPVDYGHAMYSMLSLDPAETLKAAGWFKPELRDGALWATDVSWTPTAVQKLTDREFRYHSAVFRISKDKETIEELLSVGLTNTPAMFGQAPLMASAHPQPPSHSEEPKAMELTHLIAMLSLSPTATEADVSTELARRQAGLQELVALTGQREISGILGAVKAWKASSDSVAALTGRIQELERKAHDEQVTAMLTAAQKEGRVTPAMEPMLRTMNPDQLKAFLTTLPVFPGAKPATELPGGQQPGPNGTIQVQLTQEDQYVARMMGISHDKLAAAKASTGGQVLMVKVEPDKKAAGAGAGK